MVRQALTLADDDILGLLVLAREVVLEDGPRARRVPRLRVEGRARVVGHHAVAAAERVLHRAPRVVFGRGLHVPDVAGVPVQLPGLDGCGDVLGVADRAARSVDEPRARLEVCEEVSVDQVARALVQGRVYGYDVAGGDEILGAMFVK